MNAPAQAAQFVRHRFTVEDARALAAAGLIDADSRIELIEGELIDMPADGPRNMSWADGLGRWLYTGLPDKYAIIPGLTLVLSEFNGPKPDWYVFDRAVATADVRGTDVLLLIEQSDTTLKRDLGWKADLYAEYGVRDYWVIDLEARAVHIHRDPSPSGYQFKQRFGRDDAVSALLIPDLALTISALPQLG